MFNIKKQNGKVVIEKSVSPTKNNPSGNLFRQAVLDSMESATETLPTIKRYGVVIPTAEQSADPKVQAIFDRANKDIMAREQAITEYASLSKSAKALLKDTPITSENVAKARKFDLVHTRAQAYGSQITLADWNLGTDFVETKLNGIDASQIQWQKRNQDAAAQMNRQQFIYGSEVSNQAPVHIVDKGYYLLLHNGNVFCQSDNPDETYPVVLANLRGESRGSQSVSVSGGTYDFIGEKEYKMLLEQRPSYESIRKAYLAINNSRVQMNFAIAQKLFG